MQISAMLIRWTLACALALACTTAAWSAAPATADAHKKATAKAAPKAAKSAHKPAAKAAPKRASKQASKKTPKAAPKAGGAKPVKSSHKAASKTVAKPAWKPASANGLRPPSQSVPRAASAADPEDIARAHKAALKTPALASPVLHGKSERLTCFDGTEDRHARIGVELVGGKVDGFSYYSKWKPRTCSIFLQRNRDGHSVWVDKGTVTNVSLDRGLFLIEHGKGEYRFVFRDVDRERYCGMEGTINGTLTLRKGSESCEVTGIMEEGVPLGQAYANAEQKPPAAVAASAAEPTPPPKQTAQRPARKSESPWPTASVVIGD